MISFYRSFQKPQEGYQPSLTRSAQITLMLCRARYRKWYGIATAVWERIQSLASTLTDALRPGIETLLPGLGALLSSIFDLAIVISETLEPVVRVWWQGLGQVLGIVGLLAQDLAKLVGGITDFVNWLSSASSEQERFAGVTDKAKDSVQGLAEATNAPLRKPNAKPK